MTEQNNTKVIVKFTLDTQLKIVITRVEQQAQEPRNDFSKELQATRDETRNLCENFHKEIQAARQSRLGGHSAGSQGPARCSGRPKEAHR
jgi:ribosome-binding protein aMBF1 (putative translation factor)